MPSRLLIDPPSHLPATPGLLDVADPRPDTDPHWRGGVTYQSLCPVSATTYDECTTVTGSGAPPEPPDKEATTEFELRGATPFTVYARVDCSVVGFDDPEGHATRALTTSEDLQVERSFWTGLAANQGVVFPHLAADAEVLDADGIVLQSAATVPVTGSPLAPPAALGRLEATLAGCLHGPGIIHVPPTVLPVMAAHRLVVSSGAQLRTLAGNTVVVGSGYTGSAPDGTPATDAAAWVYATGPVFAYRGSPVTFRLEETLDRRDNTVYALAERTVLLGFDCCHVGVEVDLT